MCVHTQPVVVCVGTPGTQAMIHHAAPGRCNSMMYTSFASISHFTPEVVERQLRQQQQGCVHGAAAVWALQGSHCCGRCVGALASMHAMSTTHHFVCMCILVVLWSGLICCVLSAASCAFVWDLVAAVEPHMPLCFEGCRLRKWCKALCTLAHGGSVKA